MGSIDMYVLSFMRPSDNRARLLRENELSESDVVVTRRNAEKAGLNRPSLVTRSALLRFFGKPSIVDNRDIIYTLRYWTHHQFRFADMNGHFAHEGLERVGLPAPPILLSRTVREIEERFVPWLHCASDVEQTMGEPSSLDSWSLSEDWTYELEDGNAELSFDAGLLQTITVTPKRPVVA